jgi:hypothetical protein
MKSLDMLRYGEIEVVLHIKFQIHKRRALERTKPLKYDENLQKRTFARRKSSVNDSYTTLYPRNM